MTSRERHPLLRGTLVTSFGTLLSRILGLVRDMATASLFGLAVGGVMDALVVAFRIPNLFRSLFGEGALTASYLPVFAKELEHDRPQGWRLFSATLVWLGRTLLAIVIIGELFLAAWGWLAASSERTELLIGLSAVLLPYLIAVCFAALTAATLQTLGRFAIPALAPAVLNIFWIVGALVVAPLVSERPSTQAYVVAVCLLFGGLMQWLMQWIPLRQAGFRFQYDPHSTRDKVRHIYRGILPTILGLAVLQINSLLDSIIAWVFSAPIADASSQEVTQTISWLGGVRYPMEQGATAAIYLGERMYQLPVGLLGIAVATVVFPLISRHAARGDLHAVGRDLTRGLQLVLLGSIPCAVGLVLLAEPISRLLFERGQFTASDSLRTARMIAVYGCGVWAYCSLPALVRGYYALGDRTTPLRIALATVAINIMIDFSLIWSLAERGLAAGTAVSAAFQVALLGFVFSKTKVRLDWPKIASWTGRVALASAILGVVVWFTLGAIDEKRGTLNAFWRVVGPMAAGGGAYVVAIGLTGGKHLRALFARD